MVLIFSIIRALLLGNHVRTPLQPLHLLPRRFKEETPAQEIDEQDLENRPARIESRAHGRRQSSGLQHGCWMNVPPPANRKPDNRRVHKGYDAEYRGDKRAAVRVENIVADQEVSDVEHPEDERGGEA